ncbi:MAG: ubiquinone biosynthesis accessory factor UbiJ [Cellvibrionaceae bacterium]
MTHTGFSTSLLTALTAAIEATVNTALRYDPASRGQIALITDILAIETSLPSVASAFAPTQTLTLYCHGTEDGIRVMSYCEHAVATHLKGSPIALLSLLKQPTSLANSGVELAGSIGLLQQWQTLLQQLDIDWEDAISSVLGDIAGPMAADGIRRTFSWSKQQQTEQQRLLKEYLPEELNIVPSKTELDNFNQSVSALSVDTDRLNARFSQLKQALEKKAQALNDTINKKKEKTE